MKILKRLFTSKQKSEKSSSSCSRSTSTGDSDSPRKSSSAVKKDSVGREEKKRLPNKYEQIITDWAKGMQEHADTETMMSYFAFEDVRAKFEDGQCIPAFVFVAEMQKLFRSFPDLAFTYTFIKQDLKTRVPGKIVVHCEEFTASGTHTNGPYGYAHMPPIGAKNTFVQLDPEALWFSMNEEGKITDMEIMSLGDFTGPPGVYRKIGGKLEPPKIEKRPQ